MTLFSCLWAFFAFTVARAAKPQDYSNIFIASICGWLFADFGSGLAHWMLDTWGSLDTPYVGQTFIRSFREHHVFPRAMCGHDVVETNGDNCLVSIFLVLFGLHLQNSGSTFWGAFWLSMTFFICITNQIHKWSHELKPPMLVKLAQDLHIILPRKHHGAHHKGDHDDYYCITCGWMNPVLSSINFWRHMETAVTFVTGAVPRADDLAWVGKDK
mmetsp:Transcript_1090/g.2320  ORF Transcript_1090/g.2320 Transcript_1090/m.2320 type:complete len:214 (-) Transcript_1090:214-855(-)